MSNKRPDFRDKHGRQRTKSLFFETWYGEANRAIETPVYTLQPHDREVKLNGEMVVIPALRLLYLNYAYDSTEYEFAMKHIGSWSHWNKLIDNCQWFRDHLEKWREEADTKRRSKSLKYIHGYMQEDVKTPTGLAAAKFMLSGEWKKDKTPVKKKAGRPSKSTDFDKKLEEELSQQLEDDFKVIQIVKK